MANKAPGKYFREGLSTRKFFELFPDDKAAEEWFIEERWPDGICCPYCGSLNVNTETNHKTMPYRCRETQCRKWFSVKTGTPMQSSKIGCHDWLYAMYCVSTNLKGVSSMKLHRDLEITQKSSWFMLHRIRHVWNTGTKEKFAGPVEADETYMGGRRKNMPKSRRSQLEGRGPIGKTAVVGVKDRATNKVSAKAVENTTGETLKGFVKENIQPGAKVYTDDATAYDGFPNRESVRHSLYEYVRGPIHTNGIESYGAC